MSFFFKKKRIDIVFLTLCKLIFKLTFRCHQTLKPKNREVLHRYSHQHAKLVVSHNNMEPTEFV